MSTNRQKIGIAGLLFLHYLQENSFHKETGNTITKFVKTFQETKPSNPYELVSLYNTITDPIAKNMASELIKVTIAGDSKQLAEFNFLANSISTLYNILTQNIVQTKSSGKEITGTLIPMPGDIVSFLKILFLSLFDDDLYREIEIFIKSVRTNYTPRDTVYLVKKTIADNRLSPIILNMMLPEEKMLGSLGTQNLDRKINLIQKILQVIPPS